MPDEIRNDISDEVATEAPYTIETREPATGDAEKGAALGGVGGLVTGAIAGSAAGPAGALLGAVIGGVVGAAASGIAVAAVDRIDDDSNLSGIPDDMSLDSVSDREPTITDRAKFEPDTPSTARETTFGAGMQEATAMTEPSLTAEQTGAADMGWERDNDANTIDVNPSGIEHVNSSDANESGSFVETTGSGTSDAPQPKSYAYLDEPKDA